MNIYFDETQIDNDKVTGLSYDSKLINDNDMFGLGQTVCNMAILKVDRSLTTQPSIVTIVENGTTTTYNVDNTTEDKTSYIYTLTDNMVNFNFRYDAQPLIEASQHTEPDGTKYVTLLELVQDMCSKANLSLITTDFAGYDKHITWYDNTITAREYIGMVAELNGGYAIIDNGLVFKKLTNGEVKSITGKNLFDINTTPAYLNTTTTQKLDNGIRAIDTSSSGSNHFALFKVLDVTNYVGKTFSIKMQFQANGTNQGQFVVGLCDENGGNRIASKWGTTSGQEVSFTIPTITTSNYLALWLYSNASGTSTANNYVDYTNIMVNEGSTALSYEPYENPNITIQDGTETSLVGCNIEGNSYQYTTSGKNLLDINSLIVTSNTTQQVSGSTLTLTSTGAWARAQKTLTLKSNTSYTLMGWVKGTSGYNAGLLVANSSQSYERRTMKSNGERGYLTLNFDTSVSTELIIQLYTNWSGTSASTTTTFEKVMLVEGTYTTEQSYEPYTNGASPNPDYPQEVEVVETYNLLNKNKTLGTPSDTTFTNTTKRTFNFNNYIVGLSVNNFYSTSVVTNVSVDSNAVTLQASVQVYGVSFPMKLKPNATYTLSYKTSATANENSGVGFYQQDGTFISFLKSTSNNNSLTFTTPRNCYFTTILFTPPANTLLTYTNIQLEESSIATTYIPYNNIGVNVVGKNLLNVDLTFPQSGGGITITKDTDGKLNLNGTISSNASIYLTTTQSITLEAGTYTLSTPSSFVAYLIPGYKARTFTLTETTTFERVYIAVQGTTGTQINESFYPMLVKGSTLGEYEPYTLSTTPIDLQGNFIGKIGTIKDELNIDDLGNVILTKRIGKVVLNGSETWLDSGYNASAHHYTYQGASKKGGQTNLISNKFITSVDATKVYSCVGNASNTNITLKMPLDISNTTQMKTWLASNNTIVYYELLNPYTINLGKANIELNEGVNYITFLTNLYTRNTIEYTSQDPEYTIDIDDCESYNIGEYHKITRVAMENGLFEPIGTDEGTTIYINPNNVFITEQSDVDSIYRMIKGFEYYSLEIKKGDIEIIPTGTCIALVNDNNIYKTYAQLNLNYNGGWYGKYHFITGSNKQEETAVYNSVEDNYKRLKLQVDREKNEIGLLAETKLDSDEYTKAEIVARINDSSSQVKIEADSIDLNGVVTANNNFKINLDGTMECTGASIKDGSIQIKSAPQTAKVELINSNDTTESLSLSPYWLWMGEELSATARIFADKNNGYMQIFDKSVNPEQQILLRPDYLIFQTGTSTIGTTIHKDYIDTKEIIAGNIDCGTDTVGDTATTISFNKTFTNPPKVVATPYTSATGTIPLRITNITTTNFTIIITGTQQFGGVNVNWIAIS